MSFLGKLLSKLLPDAASLDPYPDWRDREEWERRQASDDSDDATTSAAASLDDDDWITCPHCGGTGDLGGEGYASWCNWCDTTGRIRKPRT